MAGVENILQNGVYDFSNPSATPNGLNGVFQNDYEQAISKLDSVTAKTSTGNLFNLPGGPVGVGFGTEFRHEELADQLAHLQRARHHRAGQRTDGRRRAQRGRGLLPDRHSDHPQPDVHAGRPLRPLQRLWRRVSPSFALRFQPVQALTTFASYSRGFRAPTLVENSQAIYLAHQNLVDPNDPSGVPTKHFTTEQVNGNPNLDPSGPRTTTSASSCRRTRRRISARRSTRSISTE